MTDANGPAAVGAAAGRLPTYAELLTRTDAPPGSAWGIFGLDDERGTINFLTPERVKAATACVQRGAVLNLDLPLDAFDPPIARHRRRPRHTIFQRHANHRDDYLDSFYLQVSTQIDGLRHRRHPAYGFYNGAPDESIAPGTPGLGIQRWAATGIVGRGVLVDVERYLDRRGERLDYRRNQAFPIEVLDAALAEQGVRLQPGDILLLRTGWLRCYFEEMTAEERRALPDRLRCPGLLQSQATLAWLWDHQISLLAADTVAVEAFPPDPTSPFPPEPDDPALGGAAGPGMMHGAMIALLGLAIGELWALDALADDCARDGRWECLVVAKPLYLVGGVGSPANAIAIK